MKKINEFVLFVFFKVIYDFIYIFITTDIFDYMNSILVFNIYRYIINWIVFLLLLISILYFLKDNIMSFVLKSLFIFSAIPTISLYGLKEMNNEAFFLMTLYWGVMICSFALIQNLKIYNENKKSKDWYNNFRYTNILFVGSIIMTIFLWGFYGDFRILISFSNVYDYRLALREVQIPSFLRYAMLWLGNVFLPYCFTIFLLYKKVGRAIITFSGGVMLFSINGLKSWLIVYFLIACIFFIYKKGYRLNRYTGVLSLLVIMYGLIAIIMYMVGGSISLVAMYHRVFSVPAEINYNYFTFFSNNEALLLRESILRHIASSPYAIGSSFIIGDLFGGNSTTNANNGMFGDAYANFKTIGILIYPIVLSVIFKILDSFTRDRDTRVVISILLILIWNLINASFFMWLLSGGVVIFLLLFYFDRKRNLIQ
ncbi:O-antigen ligase [Schinkia azotoformans]|uniref:O-antigen polymerase n=1 Tax=Schinkia azotoformans LMG 9581 TaxID=1131731 RepID=K6BV05_SCHAZ|nr:O-antigen polymerase [Schinkia azotoformans]EKN62760.1 hypothetical protein BAZO_20123 [Schinkia azotoformans LMG 9581]MEC1639136.1 O-antigen ligase [Schinkia azotoformans]MEC1945724.1 O-antigen ligase [Schinkia azotoformans]